MNTDTRMYRIYRKVNIFGERLIVVPEEKWPEVDGHVGVFENYQVSRLNFSGTMKSVKKELKRLTKGKDISIGYQ